MDAVSQALQQVQVIRGILERRRFDGLSGKARVTTALATLVTGGVLALVPADPVVHLYGWFGLCVFAVIANFGSLASWFLFDPSVKRDWRRLLPVLDIVPSLVVGCVMTVVLVSCGQADLLFGAWMCMFGLCNISARHILPIGVVWIGLFYLNCGLICLLAPISFLDPLPMVAVFAFGEALGGALMIRNQTRNV